MNNLFPGEPGLTPCFPAFFASPSPRAASTARVIGKSEASCFSRAVPLVPWLFGLEGGDLRPELEVGPLSRGEASSLFGMIGSGLFRWFVLGFGKRMMKRNRDRADIYQANEL